MRDLRNAPEQYPGEALDCAMMLARLDHGEDEIAASIERNFPTAAPAARQLAKDALIAVQAERS